MLESYPTEIGKYRIVELVGEGAMGTVFRATDSVIGRTVAVKVMNASIAREGDHRQRFLREAQTAGSLQHPNVVTIYDMGEVDGHLFIAMEFVHGSDLDRLMSLSEPLKLQSKLDIIVDVLTGLAFAHKHGIVHRDIKPSNIRVGDDGRAKIMDFGVAHLASSDMTRPGVVVGTPSYMAPEQVTGDKTVPGTDIFAVGAVLYHLLAGVKPFEGTSLQSLFYKIVTDMPAPIADIKPGVPPALDRITRKAMAKDPAMRYATALEMANEIIAVRSELSGAPYPVSASLTSSAVAAAQPPAAAASDASKSAAKPTRTLNPLLIGGAAAAVLLVGWLALGQRNDRGDAVPSPGEHVANVAAHPSTDSTPVQPASTAAPETTASVASRAPEVEAGTSMPATRSEAQTPRRRIAEVIPPRIRERLRANADRRANMQAGPPPAPPQVRSTPPASPAIVQSPAAEPERRPVIVVPPPGATQRLPDPAPAAPASPDREVAALVESYARAIESKDIGAVRRAYPGITADQARGFEQFFQSARTLNVTFRVVGLEASGNSAEARLVGSYDYVTSGGRSERQPVSFAAVLRHDGNAWRLTSVR